VLANAAMRRDGPDRYRVNSEKKGMMEK
jgi:hypothetical protein